MVQDRCYVVAIGSRSKVLCILPMGNFKAIAHRSGIRVFTVDYVNRAGRVGKTWWEHVSVVAKIALALSPSELSELGRNHTVVLG